MPPSFRELNLEAFDKGLDYATTGLSGTPSRPEVESLTYSEG